MDTHGEKEEIREPAVGLLNLDPLCSRRRVLKMGGISIIGISALAPHFAQGATKPLIVMDKAQGIVIADPLKCVGCGRCEFACTEFNDGKAAPKISRIKIDRNLAFGPEGLLTWREGRGNWGDGVVVQDLCKQCPHPVPCANICPENAIVAAPSGKARMVDLEKCTGCKICLKACPWEMISFDPDTRKATKCHLCSGKPKCVEACPAEALSYVPWLDLTHKVPPRVMRPDRASPGAIRGLPGVPPPRSKEECQSRDRNASEVEEGRAGPLRAGVRLQVDRPDRHRLASPRRWFSWACTPSCGR